METAFLLRYCNLFVIPLIVEVRIGRIRVKNSEPPTARLYTIVMNENIMRCPFPKIVQE
jgi:hypothetical protein